MTLLEAVHSEAGTFHSFAAAWTSIMRAAAPPLRTYSFDWRTPRLPPVENSPQGRLRGTPWPGVGYSISTLFQSQSSSSAMSCAGPGIVPWPISARTARIRGVFSGRVGTQTGCSGDPAAARRAHGQLAGAHRQTVQVHGAGAALRHAAAVLGAGEADLFADHPEQGRGRIDVDLVRLAVDCQAHGVLSPLWACGQERFVGAGHARTLQAQILLLEYLLHIKDQVGAVARLGHARVRHAIGRHGLLRIRDIRVQCLRRPGDAALLEDGGVAEVIQFRRPSPEDSVKARSDAVDAALGRLTRVAFLEQLLAVLRIALHVRDPSGEERGRGRD